MDSFLTEYVDLFRHFHPEAKDVYSVWDQKTDARIHNEGVRCGGCHLFAENTLVSNDLPGQRRSCT